MTKEQLLAEFEEMLVQSKIFERGDGAIQQTSKLLSQALDKYGAEEYERGRREAVEAERERIGEGIKKGLPPGVFEINVHKVLQVIYDTPSNQDTSQSVTLASIEEELRTQL